MNSEHTDVDLHSTRAIRGVTQRLEHEDSVASDITVNTSEVVANRRRANAQVAAPSSAVSAQAMSLPIARGADQRPCFAPCREGSPWLVRAHTRFLGATASRIRTVQE